MIHDPLVDAAPRPSGALRELRLWLVSLALFAPALVPYASHFAFHPPGRLATGFIQYDMPNYLANAREHFDAGHFRFLYSNPFDPNYGSPAIYTQPMTLALGVIMHVTGIAPHHLFLIFELLAGWVCARVAVALYAEVVGLDGWARRLGLVVFFWGGGLLVLAAVAYLLATQGVVWNAFIFDPFDGWWFLNFGRNLVYPTESLYHALFFGCILSVLRQRFAIAAVVALVLSWSHPFSGVELLLILTSWSALEVFFVRKGAVPTGFLVALLILLGLHLGYYLVFLTRFPEHRAVMKIYARPWLLQATAFVPAYALVGALAAWSFRCLELARTFFAKAPNRLYLVWFLVAFALANHEFAVKPIQPLHFTRGYIWTPLFLMGISTLVGLFTALKRRGGPVLGSLAVGAVVAVLLLDNALWLGSKPWDADYGQPWTVPADQFAVYRWLSRPENRGALLIPDLHGRNWEVDGLGYLAAVYTPLRSWIGDAAHTPDLATRRREVAEFLESGRMVDAWRGKSLLVALDRHYPEPGWLSATGVQPVYENPTYLVFRLSPATSQIGSGHREQSRR